MIVYEIVLYPHTMDRRTVGIYTDYFAAVAEAQRQYDKRWQQDDVVVLAWETDKPRVYTPDGYRNPTLPFELRAKAEAVEEQA